MAPPRGYGHAHGVNMANYRLLSETRAKEPGYRSPYDWQLESAEHADMSFNEYKLSSTLRQASSQLQATTNEQVVSDITTVEAALKTKLRQTDQLRAALQATVLDTVNEIDACAQLKVSMEQRLKKVTEKLELNEARLQVRGSRPARERTMDDVEGVLLHQQGLMSSFIEKVKRALSHLDREIQQLEHVRNKLEADLRDKVQAIDVDTKALMIQADGDLGEAASLQRRAEGSLKTPHTWVNCTEDNIRNARRWLADSARLRKAIRHAVHDARMAEHDMSRSLNSQMINKIGQTKAVKNQLERQLEKVQEELSNAQVQRASLVRDLEAKRGPLQQAKDRLQARRARPDREQVSDDVETALTVEIAHLNGITQQLASKLNSVDKTISNLDLASLTLEENIHAKETTLSIDERMALLDGRINLHAAPPTSVASYMSGSQASEVRDATLKRIQELENELTMARQEREALEGNIAHLRTTLGTPKPRLVSSPKGALSPTRLFTP